MTIKDTSLAAYWSEKVGNRIGRQQAIILEELALYGGATRSELVIETGLPINAVCGRVNELMKLGLVVECEKVQDERTGKRVYVLRLRGDDIE